MEEYIFKENTFRNIDKRIINKNLRDIIGDADNYKDFKYLFPYLYLIVNLEGENTLLKIDKIKLYSPWTYIVFYCHVASRPNETITVDFKFEKGMSVNDIMFAEHFCIFPYPKEIEYLNDVFNDKYEVPCKIIFNKFELLISALDVKSELDTLARKFKDIIKLSELRVVNKNKFSGCPEYFFNGNHFKNLFMNAVVKNKNILCYDFVFMEDHDLVCARNGIICGKKDTVFMMSDINTGGAPLNQFFIS